MQLRVGQRWRLDNVSMLLVDHSFARSLFPFFLPQRENLDSTDIALARSML